MSSVSMEIILPLSVLTPTLSPLITVEPKVPSHVSVTAKTTVSGSQRISKVILPKKESVLMIQHVQSRKKFQ